MNSYQDELKKVLLTYDADKIKEFMHKHNKNMPRNNLAIYQTAQTKKKNFRENG